MNRQTRLPGQTTLVATAAADAPRGAAQPAFRVLPSSRPHIGLLVLFGPEVGAFLHSGLAGRLARRHRVSLITTNPASASFSRLERMEVHPVPARPESRTLNRLRWWSQQLHEAWMESQGLPRWRHEPGSTDGKSGAGRWARRKRSETKESYPLRLRAVHLLERAAAHIFRDDRPWKQLYQQMELDCLVTAAYAGPDAVLALQAATVSDLATVVLTNSWKDVYSHPYVAVPPNGIGVTGQPEADRLRQSSPHIQAESVVVVGSLQLQRFLKPAGIINRTEFCRRAGLDAGRPFLCYTAAAPQAVVGEESIVAELLEAIAHHPARPQVLLRLNPREGPGEGGPREGGSRDGGPREGGERFEPLRAKFTNLVIQKPRWEWDRSKAWNAPLAEDFDSWVASVYHSAFNVSIPSTVTLEFAAMGRLTLNVCFDADPRTPPEASNARFWDAPFYRQVRKSPFVAAAFSKREFRELLASRLAEPAAWTLPPRRTDILPVDAAEKLVLAALHSRTAQQTGRVHLRQAANHASALHL